MVLKRSYKTFSPFVFLPLMWLALVLFCAIFAETLPLPGPDEADWQQLASPPGSTGQLKDFATQVANNKPFIFRLGSDTLGRDVLTRIIFGARISLAIGILSPLVGLLIGGMLGMLAGYYRGRLEQFITSSMDLILAFPGLVLLLAVTFHFGASLPSLIPCLGFLTIPAFCRVARINTLNLAEREFILAARSIGATDLSIIFREIMPNLVGPLSVYAVLVMAVMIIAETALSYFGLGVPPPSLSWGGMIAGGREVLNIAPHICLLPALALFLTTLSLNILGDTLRNSPQAGKK